MNPSTICKSTLAVAIASTIATTAAAQETVATQPTMMNQVTVTATRTERELGDVASSVSMVTAEDAEKNMARNIQDLVKYEPGINVTGDSRFGLGSFNVRGMDQNRVKITVDGVDQANSFGYKKFIQSQRNYFDIENMKAMEVVKGPSSTLHGGDAIGGVVAFVTKDPSDYLKPEGDDSYASVKAGYNSADSSFNETVTFANRVGDLESMLTYTRRDMNERKTHGGQGGTGAGREKADPLKGSSDSLLGKLQYQLNDDHRIGLTGEWQESRTKSDLESLAGDTIGGTEYLSANSDDNSKRHRVGIFHEWQADNAAFDDMKWSLNWQKSHSRQKTYDTVIETEGALRPTKVKYDRLKDYYYQENSLQFDATFNKSFDLANSSHYVTYGVSLEETEQDNLNKTYYSEGEVISGPGTPGRDPYSPARYAPVSTHRQLGFFLQDEIGLMEDRLILTPGIRYDRFDVSNEVDEYTPDYADPSALDDKTYDSWTAQIGAVFEINDIWSTFAQYSQGFSTPNLFDMYFEEHMPAGMPVWVKPNPNLKPEESDSYEIGLRANSNLGSMEVTAFYNDYKNFIERVSISDPDYAFGVYQAQNLSEATIKGIEFKGMLWLDEAFNAPRGTRLNTAIAWSKGRGTRVAEDYTVHENEPLNSISPLTAVFGLGYDDPSNTWGSDLTWTLVAGKKKGDISELDRDSDMGDTNDDGDQFATPGYGLVDLTAYYKPHKDVTINAGIFNITDKKYWHWDDVRGLSENYDGLNRYTQPGRNYSVSVKWEI